MTDPTRTDPLDPAPRDAAAVQPTRRRRRRVIAASVAALALSALIAVLVFRLTSAPGPTAQAAPPMTTVPVSTGDMVSATNARGVLHYAQEQPLLSGSGGVITALPAVGATLAPGATLYSINTQPVLLLRGSQPAWRPFELGMTAGEDVRQLEQNLTALGVPFSGDVDAVFTPATATAIKAWQKDLGVERTGRLDRSAVLFADHDLRVSRLTASLGREIGAGAELFQVSATSKVVDLDLGLADQQLAVVGAEVGVTLPDGSSTAGSIAVVGEPLERSDDDAAEASSGAAPTAARFVVPVTVTLSDQAAAGTYSRASVSVQFGSTLAAGVLTVPVEALVATTADSFAVETPDEAGTVDRIAVTVGAFASGRVEVTGDGIREGLEVVVPES